jgi:ABC-type glutathione transport system ATPase component
MSGLTGRSVIPKRVSQHEEREVELTNMEVPQEEVPDSFKQQIANNNCVDIRGLRKVFSTTSGVKVAVNDLSLTIYSGQITALLGHNGIYPHNNTQIHNPVSSI